jgi:hypothetical protein
MKYSRLIVLFPISFACVAINYRLVTTGHYRAPLFVFLACLIAVPLIFRRLPPVTTNPQEIRRNQSKATSAFRRMGFLYSLGLVLGLISWFSGGFKELPTWGNIACDLLEWFSDLGLLLGRQTLREGRCRS